MSTHALTPPLALVKLLRRPLRHVPCAVQQAVLGPLLAHVFAARAGEGELDFLGGRTLAIDIRDLGLCWHVTLAGGRLALVARDGEATARVSGDMLAFLQLAAREEDADTLFFQRRLVMQGDTGVGTSLFTVHADQTGRYAAVGGTASGIIVELEDGTWRNATPDDPPPPGLSGVALGADGFGVAVGSYGAVFTRSDDDGWSEVDLGFSIPHTLHGAWIDDQGCAWAVGGQVLTPPFVDGLLLHSGPSIPAEGLE